VTVTESPRFGSGTKSRTIETKGDLKLSIKRKSTLQ